MRASHRSRIGSAPPKRRIRAYVRREDAERFIEEVRSDEPELAKDLRIGERELEAGTRTTGGRLCRAGRPI
jgi:hypothetical protein